MSNPIAASPFALFNNKLIDFVDDLGGVLGHLPEYTVLSSSGRFLAQFQVRQNHELFERYVAVPYGASILTRDETFLLEEAKFAGNAGIVSLIKSVWRSLPAADRDSVWAHLHVLMVLGERCKAAA